MGSYNTTSLLQRPHIHVNKMKMWSVCVLALVVILTAESVSSDTDASNRQSRVFAYYSTTSYTKLSTVTISAISTCLSTTTTATMCKRRKRRSLDELADLFDMEDDVNVLETSVNEDPEDREKRSPLEDEQTDRDGKILTIWTTDFATITLTTTSPVAGTTVTASAYCTAGDGSLGNSCFLG